MTKLRRRRIAPPLLYLALVVALGACHRHATDETAVNRGQGPEDETLRQAFGNDFARAAAARPTDAPMPLPPAGSAGVNAQAEPVSLNRR